MISPPLPGVSWLPTMAPSSTTHRPPERCLLVALWPLLALTCQPRSVLPSKIDSKPSSSVFAFLSSAPADDSSAASQQKSGERRADHGHLLDVSRASR
jgi:hypothetical protein